jgi:hypothetical protein
VECHHLIHWADGGTTDTWNLCCLCDFHHDAHHDGQFTIAGNADDPEGLSFTNKRGFPIRPGPTFTTPVLITPTFITSALSTPALFTATDPCPGSSGSPGSKTSPAPPGAPPPTTTYRGPSGDKLSLRWVTFDEPREPALV